MSNRKQASSKFAALVIAFVIGVGLTVSVFYVLSIVGNKDSSLQAESVLATSEREVNEEFISSPSMPVRAQQQSLDEIAELGPLHRHEALIELANNADERRLVALLTQTKSLVQTPTVQAQMQAVLLQSLVRIDPVTALSQATKIDGRFVSYLLTAVFSEWVHVDLDEAVSYATTLDGNEEQAALEGILQETAKLDGKTRREIARQLGNEQYAINAINLERLEQASEDPESVWKDIVEDAQDDPAQLDVLKQVALTWVEKRGLTALTLVIESLDNTSTSSTVATYVLSRVARTNPSEAFAYSLNLDSDIRQHAKLEVVAAWAETDPRKALDAVSEVPESRLRSELLRGLMDTWASFHPADVLQNSDDLPSEFVVEATIEAVESIAGFDPVEAANIVSGMEHESMKLEAARTIVRLWTLRDARAALDWPCRILVLKVIAPC